MRWRDRRRSTNVEDRRGQSAGRRPLALGGGAIFLVVVVAMLFGGDPGDLLRLLGAGGPAVSTQQDRSPAPPPPEQDEQAEFVSVVLADTEETWQKLFAGAGKRYEPPKLVLFTDAVPSACGFNSAAVGPFYCPADHKVYIDLSFFRDLHSRFGAPGDFAQAYVIAHEVGHHVQNLLGISDDIHRRRAGVSQAEGNALSVRMELQADCLAGVWGYYADVERRLLERGDVEEGLRAAAAIGDDTIQRRSSGRVSPESWTHGSSEQRVEWFKRGLESGDTEACDTFAGRSL